MELWQSLTVLWGMMSDSTMSFGLAVLKGMTLEKGAKLLNYVINMVICLLKAQPSNHMLCASIILLSSEKRQKKRVAKSCA